MSETITATKLARNLSDILNRVHYKGERFIVERNGQPVAEILPAQPKKIRTLGDLIAIWDTLPKPDDDYWKELAEIQANQPLAEFPEWD
ncbi:MAG: type II toxin-antitoxin system Phd/YefM family antitoxin [Thermomicrobiales bacterium]